MRHSSHRQHAQPTQHENCSSRAMHNRTTHNRVAARSDDTLHGKYVSTVSGPGADTDRIHCIWTWIQWIHHVLYLTVSGPRPDTVRIQWIQYVSHRIYHVGTTPEGAHASNMQACTALMDAHASQFTNKDHFATYRKIYSQNVSTTVPCAVCTWPVPPRLWNS